jgi:hypothetical protein
VAIDRADSPDLAAIKRSNEAVCRGAADRKAGSRAVEGSSLLPVRVSASGPGVGARSTPIVFRRQSAIDGRSDVPCNPTSHTTNGRTKHAL